MSRLSKLLCKALKTWLETQKRPILPAGGDLLWRWFADLHSARSYGMVGPNPVGFTEIHAYLQVMRIPAEPHHVEILRAMDSEYLAFAYSKAGGKQGRQPSGDLTAAGFDALFG